MKIIASTLLLAAFATPASAETLEYLVAERIRADARMEIPDGADLDVMVSNAEDGRETISLPDFYVEPSNGKFVANAIFPGGETARITGVAVATVDVPVPSRKLMPDDIIQEDDLKSRELPHTRVAAFAVVDPENLIGMQVKRVLSQGRPIMSQSVTPPVVIERGERVDITYDNNGMSLTAPGKSLADVALGEDVKVVNLVSNKTVVGVAQKNGSVEIENW